MPTPPRGLKYVRAAQLRARLGRRAIGQLALGTVFLMGALSFGYGPQRQEEHAAVWMAFLSVLSTFNVASGARLLSRSKGWPRHTWWICTAVWGVLLVALLWALGRV